MEKYTISPDRIEIHAQAEVKRQRAFLGKRTLRHGMKLWECNLETGDVRQAVIDVAVSAHGKILREVVVKENCLYDFAINGVNAVRKFENLLKKRS